MKEYSFADTILLINGIEMKGYAEGDDVIQLARLNDSAQHSIGASGEMTVAISSDRSGTITFNLQQSSESNLILSGLVSLQENSAFTPVAVQFKDTRGNDIVSGSQGYLNKPADMVRGLAVNGQEWVITVERLDIIHGGTDTI